MFHAKNQLPSLFMAFAFGLTLSGSAAFAQGRNQTPSTNNAPVAGTPNVPDQTGGKGPSTTPDGPRPGGENTGGGGGSVGGLPDAVTVLEILRRLPRFPGGGRNDIPVDDTGPENGPESGPETGTPTGPANSPKTRPKPSRVVVIPTTTPFAPKPTPRTNGAPAPITGAIGPEALDREVLVTLGPGSSADTVFALSQDLGLDGQTVYVSPLLGSRLVRFSIPDTRSVADVVQQLSTDARVEIASPHYVYTASQGAAKPLPAPQYAPKKLNLDAAHRIALGKRIKIAVIDTAVDTTHPAFKGSTIAAYDALGGTKGEAEAHGTAIAGIVGAREGLEGVAPAAELLTVRAFTAVEGAAAKSYTLAVLKGLDWAVANGARVINMSFAGPPDPILEKALKAAEAQGVVLVAAAGNGGPKAAPAYPGAYKGVIAVTATDDGDELYQDANRGDYIAVAAPGVDIIAAAPKGAYDISSGTSLAAAHISGIAALMLEKNPRASAADIRAAIASSAKKLSGKPATDVGAGVADAAAAVSAVK